MNFNWVFHYKPSILGYHYFWKHPNAGDGSHFFVFGLFWGPGSFLRKIYTPFWAFEGGMVCSHRGSETAKKRQIITLPFHFSIVFSWEKKNTSSSCEPLLNGTYFPVMGFPGIPVLPRCLLREMPHADPDEDGVFSTDPLFLSGLLYFFQFQVFSNRKMGSF